MSSQAQLKSRIMRRVYTVYFLRQVTSPWAVKTMIFLAAFWQFTNGVYVAMVFQNMTSMNIFGSIGYLANAFTATDVAVQASILAMTAAAALLALDFTHKKSEAKYWL